MRPMINAVPGALLLCALILLTACAPRETRQLELVEVPTPVLIPIPSERVEYLALPDYPSAPLANGALERYTDGLEDIAARCNIDRQWIRNRQAGQDD